MSVQKIYRRQTGPTGLTGVGGNPTSVLTSLTAAQIIAMYTTGVALTPVPGTGKAVILHGIVVLITRTSTQFTGGGVVIIRYNGQTTELMSASIAAASIIGTAGTSIFYLNPAATAGGSVVTSAVAVEISNLTGVFAAGTGTAKVYTRYSIITL